MRKDTHAAPKCSRTQCGCHYVIDSREPGWGGSSGAGRLGRLGSARPVAATRASVACRAECRPTSPAAWPAARSFALLRSERRLSVSRGGGVSTSNVSTPGNGFGVDNGLIVVAAAMLVSALPLRVASPRGLCAWPLRIGGRNVERSGGGPRAAKPFVAMKSAVAASASGWRQLVFLVRVL